VAWRLISDNSVPYIGMKMISSASKRVCAVGGWVWVDDGVRKILDTGWWLKNA